ESHPRSPSQSRSQQYHQSPFSHSHRRRRNLPDLSEGGQQQHHQEEQSSQSLGEDPFISSLHQLRASLHNCFSYYKIIKSRNSRTKKR
ncbi:15394_t:CDS:2, partial [Rhizophagus irregularis]